MEPARDDEAVGRPAEVFRMQVLGSSEFDDGILASDAGTADDLCALGEQAFFPPALDACQSFDGLIHGHESIFVRTKVQQDKRMQSKLLIVFDDIIGCLDVKSPLRERD